MSSHQPVDVGYVADLVRSQGEELLRVRRELEESQKMRDILIDASRSMEKQFDDLYETSIQWHLRLENLTQEFAALKTGSEAFLAELDVARIAFNNDLTLVASTSLVHPSGTVLAQYTPATAKNVSDEISSVSELSVSSNDIDDDYETVVPPSPALNLNPNESTNAAVTQEVSVTATPPHAASVSGEHGLENYAAGDGDGSDCAANGIVSATIPVSNGTHDVSSTTTQFSLGARATSSLNPRLNTAYEHFSVAGMNPVCTKLPKTKARKAVSTMCHIVIGNLGIIPIHIFKHPEALFAQPNRHHTLVTVSREARDPSHILKKLNGSWVGHLLLQNNSSRCLFYLGQYQCEASQKMTVDEYHPFPEETKKYVLNCAKGLRPREISAQEQLLLSLEKDDGIYVAKTVLRSVEFSTTIEAKLRAKAKQKGYL